MKVIIIGAYGTAVNIADSISHASLHYGVKDEVLGFAIDNAKLGSNIGRYPILCTPDEIAGRYAHDSEVKVIFCLYHPSKMKERSALLHSYKIPDSMFHTFIHPSTYVAQSARIGFGTVVLANCSIMSNVRVGCHNVINSNTVIEHDSQVGNNSFIAASVCIGSLVTVEDASFIGLNASIRESSRIGKYSFVGMSSNVISNVDTSEVVFGNPARTKNERS